MLVRPRGTAMSRDEKFLCSNCQMSCKYDYFGRNPPCYRTLETKEHVYTLRDPFTSQRGCIILGAHCHSCGKSFCMANECSIFYNDRYCLKCAKEQLSTFPKEIQEEIERKLS